MLMKVDDSLLLVVDVQEKLVPAINNDKELLHACEWLIDLAAALNAPVMASEHYSRGLGQTVPNIRARLCTDYIIEKNHFSLAAEPGALDSIRATGKSQIIICGAETHVCVMQTALELLASGFDVYLVADAVGSRSKLNHSLAISRMRDAGITIVSREMVAWEWLGKGGSAQFKAVLREFLK